MNAFIARQPIFDRELEVTAYELLFRSTLLEAFQSPDPDRAASRVVANALMVSGLDQLTGGRPAWIDMSREILLEGHYRILPAERTVLQVPVSVGADCEVRGALERARATGYRIALSGFLPGPALNLLTPAADAAKVNARETADRDIRRLARILAARNIPVTVTGIENRDRFNRVREYGCDAFQGDILAPPTVHRGRDIPTTQVGLFRVLQEVHRPSLDLGAIEELIESELALSYKLLRYLHSAYFGWRGGVNSIRHALMLLGEEEFRSWASVIVLSGMADDQPEELVKEAVVRGRFCQLLAGATGHADRASDYFILGLFSLLDAILGRPMPVILADLAIDDEVKRALQGEEGSLRHVLDAVVAYTRGDWSGLESACDAAHLDSREFPVRFAGAVHWTETGQEPDDRRTA